jgi:hypothetical protein
LRVGRDQTWQPPFRVNLACIPLVCSPVASRDNRSANQTAGQLNYSIQQTDRLAWLKAHLIAQPLLARFTSTTRDAAIKDLSSTARDRILELRKQESDYRHGRLHGFWVQQFANAQLALG